MNEACSLEFTNQPCHDSLNRLNQPAESQSFQVKLEALNHKHTIKDKYYEQKFKNITIKINIRFDITKLSCK